MVHSNEVIVPTIAVTGPIDLSSSDMEAGQSQYRVPAMCKSRYCSWKIATAVLATMFLAGWICIIALLIMKEKWQLVLVAWLLLYAAAHFTYWYCKRHSVFSLHRTVRLRIIGEVEGAAGEKEDKPPTYDEVANTEQPPPPYFTVVTENRSSSQMAEVHHPSKAAEAEATASSSNGHRAVLPTYSVAMATSTPVRPSPIRPSLADFYNRPSTPSMLAAEPEPSTSLGVPEQPVKKLSTFSSIQNVVEALKHLTHNRDETRHTAPEPQSHM
ncbi:unnamed protein product [Meganyctiphanes norvegica]|uniref:Uncharacterized protein n=1 Tax=Meganyctiphanes norvegica TaxID=48144 RepID=A0AAV2R1I7_MEGNR